MPKLLPGTNHIYIDIKKLKNGELNSFRHLYKLYYPAMLEEAIKKLIRKGEAANLVDHCFIRCWYHSGEFTSHNYILGLLHFMICNQCNVCNNNKEYRSAHHDHISRIISSGEAIAGKDNSQFLSAICKLSCTDLGPVREVFKLFYARRRSVGEISEELGLTPAYTQQRLELAFGILHLILNGNT